VLHSVAAFGGNSTMINANGLGCHLRDIVVATGGYAAYTQAAIKLTSPTPNTHGPVGTQARWLLEQVDVYGGGGSWAPAGIAVSGDDTVTLSDVTIGGCVYGLVGAIGSTDTVTATNLQFVANTTADIHWSTGTPLYVSGGKSNGSDKFLVVDTAGNAQVAVRSYQVRSSASPSDYNLIKWDGPNGLLSLEGVRFPPVSGVVPHIQLTSNTAGKQFALVTSGCSAVSDVQLADNNANGLMTVAGGVSYTKRHKPWLKLDSMSGNVAGVVDV
jgi:hypothetical protein